MPRRRHRVRVPLLLTIAAVATLIAAYVVGISHLQASGNRLYDPIDLYIPRLIDVVIVMWCVWVGSSVGSFLNVVAWRMPRGESINGRSHCPRCQAQLRARDNFPVFGWLALGGRCRTCHLPISARYPIVEASVGLSLTLIAIGQLYRFSLPRQAVHWHGGPLWAPEVNPTLLITLLYHTFAVSLAWAFGLIRMDNHRLPGRLTGFAAAVTVLPMLIYPTLMVVPWQMRVGPQWHADGMYVDAIVRVISALAAATIAARYLARGLCPAADPKLDPLGKSTARLIDLICMLAIPILIVGWQTSPAVIVVASLIAVGSRGRLPASSDALGRFAIAIAVTMTLQIVFWRRLHATWYDDDVTCYWPSDNGSPWVFLFWTALAMLVPLWLREEVPHELTVTQQVPNEPSDDLEIDSPGDVRQASAASSNDPDVPQ